MGLKSIVSVSAVAMSVCALVAVPAVVQAGPKTRVGGDPSKRVCKTVMPTGSRLVERVCRTKEEWDYNRKKAQESLFQQQLDGSIRPVPDANAPGIDRKPGGASG
ncbi:MAG TPA: hypothetical protein VIT45_13010 [Allosphingosinicella sp.]